MRTVALALGGGGAKAMAHVPVLEALDEMGVRPVALAGASFGAAIAAAYAAGMPAKEMRRVLIALAHDSGALYSRTFAARALGLASWITRPLGNPLLLDAEKLVAAFLPPQVPDDFGKLAIPLTIVATDLTARGEARLDSGSLHAAIAASVAIPGLLRPVEREGHILVDGAAVNPLPFDLLRGRADIIIALNAANPPVAPQAIPDPWEALAATMGVIGQGIIARKLEGGAPDLMLQPNAGVFRMFDFARASAIMRAADPVKADLKDKLSALL